MAAISRQTSQTHPQAILLRCNAFQVIIVLHIQKPISKSKYDTIFLNHYYRSDNYTSSNQDGTIIEELDAE